MIAVLPTTTSTCLVVKFSGKIHGAEYRDLIGRVESTISAQPALSMVLIMQDLEFPDWDAINADAHFGLKDYRHLLRVAYVGDEMLTEWFIRLISPFTHAEERLFQPDQLDQAVRWASSSSG